MTEAEKKENLLKHIKGLCERLNQNGIKKPPINRRLVSNADEIPLDSVWEVHNTDNPEFTLYEIQADKTAYNFLKQKGYLDIGLCWHCGQEPIGKEFTFTFRDNLEYICETCYSKGKNIKEGNSPVLIFNFIILFFVLYLVASLFSLSFSIGEWNIFSKIVFVVSVSYSFSNFVGKYFFRGKKS